MLYLHVVHMFKSRFQLAVKNILRYVPKRYHNELAQEFADELNEFGHIYAYRFMPSHQLNSIAVHDIPAFSRQAAAIILVSYTHDSPKRSTPISDDPE